MRFDLSKAVQTVTTCLIFVAAAAGSALGATFSIGGTIKGLAKGAKLTLEDQPKGGKVDLLTETGTGGTFPFAFGTKLASGTSYTVAVKTQPHGQMCTVAHPTGKVASANVTNIAVTCANVYSIGGTIKGLAKKAKLVLEDHPKGGAVDLLPETGTGGNISFTFSTQLVSGTVFDVTVKTQPNGQTCSVTAPPKGTGTVGTKNVTTVSVTCKTNTYSVSGTVTGLTSASNSITLKNGTATQTVIFPAKSFSFTGIAYGSSYAVTVATSPTGESCTVSANGSGSSITADVTGVVVTCTAKTFSISGTVSGLTSTANSITLKNGSATQTVTYPSTSFSFTGIAYDSSYAVTVATSPAGETCGVSANGSGSKITANVTGVVVTCSATTTTYSISGTVSGLTSTANSITLKNGSATQTVTYPSTSFSFTGIASGSSYAVTVATPPTGETCTVSANGSGTSITANVTGVTVACTASSGGGGGSFWIPYEAKSLLTFSIGGTISWPASGVSGSVTLETNNGDFVTEAAGTTSFTFPTPLSTGTQYSVTVLVQPTGGTCTVTGNATGVVDTTDITNVAVTCTAGSSSGGGGARSLGIRDVATPFSNRMTGRARPFFHPQTNETGSTGLFLIPSNKISSSPAPTWITTDPVKLHAIGVNIVFGSGGLTAYTPQLIVYSDTDFSGNTKVYGLDISDTSTTPTPVQISSLALDSTQEICNGSQGQVNLSDPTTIFVVFDIAPTGSCNLGSDTFEVVHYKDSPSTAPVTVSLNTNSFDELYNDGVQSGILVFQVAPEATTGVVNLYADETFTNPKTVFSGVNLALAEASGLTKKGYTTETSDLFYQVTTGVSVSDPTGVTTLYLIDSSGTPTQIFQGPVGSTATDDNNFYFVSTTGDTSSDTSTLYQVAATGGTPMALYVGPATITTGTPATTYALDYELTGSNDSLLVYSTTYGSVLTSSSTTLYNVPVGAKTTTPTTIATYANAGVFAFLATPSSGQTSDEVLFVSIDTEALSNSTLTESWSSIAFPAGGPYTGTPVAGSYYGDLGILTKDITGNAWRVKGIQDKTGGFEGGTFYLTDVGNLMDTAVTTTGGGQYSFPLPTAPKDNGYTGALLGLSTSGVAVGDFIDISGDSYAPDLGVALDVTNNFLYPIGLSNTDVEF